MPVLDENGIPQLDDTYMRVFYTLPNPCMPRDAPPSAQELAQCQEDLAWLWEESLSFEPSFVGTRNGSMPMLFRQLTDLHPPTNDYLDQQIAAYTALVQEGHATIDSFLDLDALHQSRGRPQDTATAMRTLADQQPELAQDVGPRLWMNWISCQQLDLFSRFLPEFDEVVHCLRMMRPKLPREVPPHVYKQPELRAALIEGGIPSFHDIVQAYRQAGRDDFAQSLEAQAAQLRVF